MENSFTQTKTMSGLPWEEIKNYILETNELSTVSFDTWISPLECELKDNVVSIKVPHQAMIEYIETKYKPLIKGAIFEVTGNIYEIVFTTRQNAKIYALPICNCGTTMTHFQGNAWYRCPNCFSLARKCYDGTWKSSSEMLARLQRSYVDAHDRLHSADNSSTRTTMHSVRLNDELIFATYNLSVQLEEVISTCNTLNELVNSLQNRVHYLESKIKILV